MDGCFLQRILAVRLEYVPQYIRATIYVYIHIFIYIHIFTLYVCIHVNLLLERILVVRLECVPRCVCHDVYMQILRIYVCMYVYKIIGLRACLSA